GREIGSGARVQDSDLVKPGDRGSDCGFAIVHVVSDADGMDAGAFERLATDGGVGEKSLVTVRMVRRPRVEAAFEIAEDDVRLMQLFGHARERYRRIGDLHQVHVTGQYQLGHASRSQSADWARLDRLFWLEAEFAPKRDPLCLFLIDVHSLLLWRAGEKVAALVGDARAHVLIGERRIELRIEPLDDWPRCPGGCHQAVVDHRDVAGQSRLRHGWQL